MSANDRGHINNLDKNEKECLKKLWISLLDKLVNEENLTVEEFVNSECGDELFHAFGCDHPDTILLRWLRARKWDGDLALEQFLQTLKWRRDFGLKKLMSNGESDLSSEELLTGKTYFIGYDKEGRPINYVSVKDHIKGQFPSEQTEKLTVFTMEIGRKLLKYPNETVTVLFDMDQFSMKNMDYQHVKFLINLLQNFYPESLGSALIINSPWLFNSCWYIIKPWIDPVVQNKIHFIKNIDDLSQFIHLNYLPKKYNGYLNDFNYIQPSQEELNILNIIKQDFNFKTKAIQSHQQSSIHFINLTLEWTLNQQQNDLIQKRNQSIQQLAKDFITLIPFIHTKTFYHRIGLINEPIFDITYQKILSDNEEEQQQVTRF